MIPHTFRGDSSGISGSNSRRNVGFQTWTCAGGTCRPQEHIGRTTIALGRYRLHNEFCPGSDAEGYGHGKSKGPVKLLPSRDVAVWLARKGSVGHRHRRADTVRLRASFAKDMTPATPPPTTFHLHFWFLAHDLGVWRRFICEMKVSLHVSGTRLGRIDATTDQTEI